MTYSKHSREDLDGRRCLIDQYFGIDSFARVRRAYPKTHLIKPDAFLDKVKAKEPLVVLDVSTPAESGVYSVTLPETLIIPSNELFTGNISVNVAR